MATLANGYIEVSNTNVSLANTLAISILDRTSANIAAFIQTVDDSTSDIKGVIRLSEEANGANFVVYNITGVCIQMTAITLIFQLLLL